MREQVGFEENRQAGIMATAVQTSLEDLQITGIGATRIAWDNHKEMEDQLDCLSQELKIFLGLSHHRLRPGDKQYLCFRLLLRCEINCLMMQDACSSFQLFDVPLNLTLILKTPEMPWIYQEKGLFVKMRGKDRRNTYRKG